MLHHTLLSGNDGARMPGDTYLTTSSHASSSLTSSSLASSSLASSAGPVCYSCEDLSTVDLAALWSAVLLIGGLFVFLSRRFPPEFGLPRSPLWFWIAGHLITLSAYALYATIRYLAAGS